MTRALRDGGIADRLVKLLQRRKAGAEISSPEAATALGLTIAQVRNNCATAIRNGHISTRRGLHDGRSVLFYSLGNGVPAAEPLDDAAPTSDRKFNCSLWEDGELVISLDDDVTTLTRAETDRLAQYLARTWSPAITPVQELLPAPPPARRPNGRG